MSGTLSDREFRTAALLLGASMERLSVADRIQLGRRLLLSGVAALKNDPSQADAMLDSLPTIIGELDHARERLERVLITLSSLPAKNQ